jgi:hypothetical protein
MIPLFQERSADLIKEKLIELFETLGRGQIVARSFKENLKGKIKLDKLEQKLVNTIREPPVKRRLNKTLIINLERRYFHGRKTDLQRIGKRNSAA